MGVTKRGIWPLTCKSSDSYWVTENCLPVGGCNRGLLLTLNFPATSQSAGDFRGRDLSQNHRWWWRLERTCKCHLFEHLLK